MVKLSEIEVPVVYKNRILFKEGAKYGGVPFTREMIETLYNNTDWKNHNVTIFEKHNKDREEKGIQEGWAGRLENLTLKDGIVRGDVIVADPLYVYKIRDMKAPYGLSAEVGIKENLKYHTGTINDYSFQGWAFTLDPRVKETFLNFENNNEEKMFLTVEEDVFSDKYLNFENEEIKKEEKIENKEKLSEEDITEIKRIYQEIINFKNNTQVDSSTSNIEIKKEETNSKQIMETEKKESVNQIESPMEEKTKVEPVKEESTEVKVNAAPANTDIPKEEVKTETSVVVPTKTESNVVVKVDSSALDNSLNRLGEMIKDISTPKPATPAIGHSNSVEGAGKDEKVVKKLMDDLNSMIPNYSQ